MPGLAGRGAEEAEPSRDVLEEVADGDARPDGAGASGPLDDPAAFDHHERAEVGVGGSRVDGDLRDGGDARKRLAAKAERADGEEVVGGRQLAGRVALEGERDLLGGDPAARVDDPDQAKPATA